MCFKTVWYKNIFCVFDEFVYEPSDDTFLLLDYLAELKPSNGSVLEIGCGCGIISIFLAKNFNVFVECCDINPYAVFYTNINKKINKVNLSVKLSCLFEEINDKFDWVIFNAPYLSDEFRSFDWTEISTINYGVVQEFLKEYKNFTKKYCLIVLNNTTIDLVKCNYEIISKKHIFFEDIYLLKLYP